MRAALVALAIGVNSCTGLARLPLHGVGAERSGPPLASPCMNLSPMEQYAAQKEAALREKHEEHVSTRDTGVGRGSHVCT